MNITNKKTIRGSGGGGGKGGGGSARVAVEEADSLQSKAFVQIIDLVGEGEIEGLVDGLKSIYLDGTPLQNQDGTYNFPGFEMFSRNGSQDQGFIPGFSTTEKEVQVNTEFKASASVVRTVTNSEVDAVRVKITLPQLTYQDPTNGDLKGSEVSYAIDLQSNGGGFQEIITDTIIGKCVSKYERSYRVDLTGDGPWDIRCRRITADSVSQTLQNKTVFEAFTEIVDGKLRYPNSALVAMKVDASQFNSVPTRGYDLKLLRIRVPTNYNPVTRTYAGPWDGSFYIAWSDNPAWVFYDLVTSERYGLGSFIPEDQVDKWGLYTIAKYCDEMVGDGFGGTEPRFTCNVYIQSQNEAYKVIQDLASTFRGMVYWAQGTLTVVQDAPEDPAFLFNTSNVVDGVFSYQGSSAKSRHTVAIITWNDPDDSYTQKVEYVEDADAIARYGIIETQVAAFGCTSRGQAHRVGRWLLYTEQYQTETVAFKTGLNGASIRPGQVILVADPARAGSRRGGRIKSASGINIVVDQDMSIDPATHTFSALLPDGTVENKNIISALGKNIVLESAFSQDPFNGSVWMVSSASVDAQYFKVLTITESDEGVHEITAIFHDPAKYDAIEQELKLEPRSISSLNTVPDSPSSVTLTETLYEVNGEVRVKVTISWNKVSRASSYLVQYSIGEGNIVRLPETSTNDIEILNAEPGTYFVKVVAVNSIGVKSVPSSATKEIVGKALPPGNVQNFSLLPMANQAYLSWDKSTDLDVLIGGSVRIRWTPNTDNPVWRNSIDIVPALAGSSSRAQVPLLSGSYMAKFVDSSGKASNEEGLIITTIPTPLALNVVETITEGPTFPGAKTSMEYFADYEGIALSAAFPIDSIGGNIDDIVNWDFAGGVATDGEYAFSNTVDLGESFSSKVTAHLLAEAVDVADFIDLREELVDTWADLDGDFIDDVNAEIWMRTTEDNPSGTPTWTDWKKFFVGEYQARAFQFKVKVSSSAPSHNIVIQELAVTIDMPDRVVNLSGVVSGAGTYNVIYEAPFKAEPTIGITAISLSSGDVYEITNSTRSGFTIVFKNSSGTPVSRTFNVLAKGYGRQAA
jgi:predicted phage tail protein